MRPAMRRLGYPLWLVGVRLGRRFGTASLAVLGIAGAAAALAVVLGGSLAAEDRRVARELDTVPRGERSVQVAYFGVLGDRHLADVDRAARTALLRVTRVQPVRVLQYRTLEIAGTVVQLRGIDDVRRWVRLSSGRYPNVCRPRRCEVVQLGGSGRTPSIPGVRLVRVGSGGFISPLPFGRLSDGGGTGIGDLPAAERGPPVLLAEGVAALGGLPALASLYRSLGWVAPVSAEDLHPWTIGPLTRDLDGVRSDLRSQAAEFDLSAPTDDLAEAAAAGRAASRRLLLVGGQTVALLLAFAVLVASTKRRDLAAFGKRLEWIGARRWQVTLSFAAEATAIVACGLVAGWIAGILLVAAVGEVTGTPPGALVAHSTLSPSGLGAAAALAGAAIAAFLLALRRPASVLAGHSISVLDVFAVGAVAVVGIGLARGRPDASTLTSDDGAAMLLLLLPGLITFVAVVVLVRLLRPALRVLERISRGRSASFRAASLSLMRNPGHAASATAFILVSVALSLFALLYRETLDRGIVDQVRFAVPADFVVGEDLSPGGLVTPLEAAPFSRYQALAPGVSAISVIRRRGTATHFGGARRDYVLLGLPATSLAEIDGWRGDFAAESPSALARRITPPTGSVRLRGPLLPRDASAVQLPVRVAGGRVQLHLSVLTTRGKFVQIDLGVAGLDPLRASLPVRARGGRLVGIELTRASGVESHAKNDATLLSGSLTLGPLFVRTLRGWQPLAHDYRRWVGRGRIEVLSAARHARLRYLVGNDRYSVFRPIQPLDGESLPVIVSPGLAAMAGSDGELPLRLGAGYLVTRVVGTARRFPSAMGDFVLADERSLFAAANGIRAGLAAPTEIWLSAESESEALGVESTLRSGTFSRLDIESRRSQLQSLRSDPLTRGALITLAIAALVSLLLALVGFFVLLVSDLRDERGELLQLEAQGAGPSVLRRHVRARALLVAGSGVLGGLVTGLLLGALVVDSVIVAANGTAPEPPLVLDLNWFQIAAVVAGDLVFMVALALIVSWNAFRSPFPARAAVSGP